MSNTVLIVIAFNLALLLLASWGFFLYVVRGLKRENRHKSAALDRSLKGFAELKVMLEKLQFSVEASASAQASVVATMGAEAGTPPLGAGQGGGTGVNVAEVQHYREQVQELSSRLAQRDLGFEQLEAEKRDLKLQVKANQMAADQLKRVQQENAKLRATLADYIAKNKASDALVKELERKLAEVQSMADETRRKLEEVRKQPPFEMDNVQLEELKDTLQRALREKQFIEEQYLELLDKVEESEEIARELQKARQECEQLEQSYMQLIQQFEGGGDDAEDDFKLEEIDE
ncbi:hypothetical protein HBA55_30175 [Pseudomaricurvus alkylphenolicus]|uniref:hypothetical protein n=1 Tax=Pseudomaricurvus alkylphenolicus TaxID=1306991 RepID=UPI001421ED73|nr:hypothetical protein [Pseudomaricurvus alkylphenolicus]NIB43908.1 hypothetical protein [Pseudomaricurvus alkylphenolicus]